MDFLNQWVFPSSRSSRPSNVLVAEARWKESFQCHPEDNRNENQSTNCYMFITERYSRTPLIRTRLLRIPLYFDIKFKPFPFTIGDFELPLFRFVFSVSFPMIMSGRNSGIQLYIFNVLLCCTYLFVEVLSSRVFSNP